MSKDPFEELFGPLADDAGDAASGGLGASETPTEPLPAPRVQGPPPGTGAPVPGIRRGQGNPAPAPVPAVTAATTPMPARQRLAHEQAERVHTAQFPSSKRGGAERSGKTPTKLPWIIVGAVAIVAIIASIVVVNAVRGNDTPPVAGSETNTTAPTTEQPETTPGTETPVAPPTEKPEPETKPTDEAPKVEVGPTITLGIEAWGATSELSGRMGPTSYNIPDSVNLQLSSELLDSFPASCEAMRTEWGATRLDNGTFQVRKPAESCAEAPELYDTVWGLVAAWVDSIKPL